MENCERIEPLFDLMMDDALTAADQALLDAHCASCASCADRRRATAALKRMFSELPPEMDVPLKAQAGWRGAVKAEAGRARRRLLTRWAGGIAAALVVAIGGMFALKAGAPRQATNAAERSVAVIEADGQPLAATMSPTLAPLMAANGAVMAEADDIEEAEEAPEAEASEVMLTKSMNATTAGASPMYEQNMAVEDLDRACAYMADLVAEYEGSLEVQRYEDNGAACANLFIDLPAENAADFLSAASPRDAGAEPDRGQPAAEGGRASILLILTQN